MGEPTEEQAKTVPTDDISRRYSLEQARMGYGLLGRFFGSATNAPTNIAGLVICLLTLTIIGIGLWFVPSSIPPRDFLNVVVPIVTLALGYLFGKST